MALCSYAVAAQAECVSSDDLIKGVIFTFDDGRAEVHRELENDKIAIDRVVDDVLDKTTIYARGVYFVEDIYWVEGQVSSEDSFSIDLGMPPSDMPLPRSGESWEVHSLPPAGSDDTSSVRIVYDYGERQTLEIGACSYKAILVEVRLPDVEISNTLGSLFLPELGTIIHVETDGEPVRKPVSLVAVGR